MRIMGKIGRGCTAQNGCGIVPPRPSLRFPLKLSWSWKLPLNLSRTARGEKSIDRLGDLGHNFSAPFR